LKKKKAVLFSTLLAISTATLLTGCNTSSNETDAKTQGITYGEYNPSIPGHQKDIEKSKPDVTILSKEHASHKNSSSIPRNQITEKKKSSFIPQFKVEEKRNFKPVFHSAWKTSPDSSYQATIEGRGDKAQEEGQGILVVQNKKTGVSKLFTLKGEYETQITPKYFEWIDENRMFVIVGPSYGTVSKGGKLYTLNISTNTVTPIIDDLKQGEEIISIKRTGYDEFIYEKHIYEDENMTKGHIEKYTLTISM
jgi:hypothetical protein